MQATSKNISGFDPRNVPGLELWLDAADTNTLYADTGGTTPATIGGGIRFWKDKSAKGRNYTSSNPPSYLSAGAITFYNGTAMFNSVTWSGAGAGVDIFVVSTPWDYTVYSDWRTLFRGAAAGHRVIIKNDSSQQIGFYGNNGAGFQQFGTLTQGQTQSLLYVTVDSTFHASAAINGTATLSAAGGTEDSGDTQPFYSLGATVGASQPWGVINEVLIYSNVTTGQRQQIEGYLAWKWNLYLLTPTAIPGCAFWLDAADDSSFTYASATNISGWTDKIGSRTLIPAFAGYNPTRVGNAVFFNNNPDNSYNGGSSYVLYYPSTWYLPSENVSVFVVSTPTATDNGNGYRSMLIIQSNLDGSSTPPNILIEMEYAYNYGSPSHEGNEYFTDFNGSYWAGNSIQGNPVVTTRNVIRLDTLIGGRTAPAFYTNGIQNSYQVYTQATGSTYTNYPVTYTIVGGAGYYAPLTGGGREYTGYIHEIIVYSAVLTASQKQQVENYLMRKWSIPSIGSNMLPITHPFSQIKPHMRRFNPTDIDGCVTWLDAADASTLTFASSNNVSTWKDKSNTKATASISASGYSSYNYLSPVYQNGGLYFNNTANYADMTTGTMYGIVIPYTSGITLNPTNVTIFMVTKPDYSKGFYAAPVGTYTSGGGGYWSAFNINQSTYPTEFYIDYPLGPGGGYIGLYNTVLLTKSVSTIRVSSTASQIYENGALDQSYSYTYTSPYTAAVDLDVGGTTNRGFPGYVYEVIVYNTVLTDSQRQQVEGYLAWKWSITLTSGHPFYSVPASSVVPFLPTNLGSSIWLDAMDPRGTGIQPPNATNLLTWIDKSGSSKNMTVYAGTPVFYQNPARIYMNGGAALINSTFTSEVYTLFIVYKQYNTIGPLYTTTGTTSITGFFPYEGGPYYYFDRGSNTWLSNTSTIPTGSVNLICVQYTAAGAGANMYVWLNGTLNISSTTVGARTVDSLVLALRIWSDEYMQADYYEVIQYDSALGDTSRQKVEGYLAWKWGLAKNLPTTHLYYSFMPPQTYAYTAPPFSTITFSYTGADQTWLVPTGVTSVNVVLYGAGGENGYPGTPNGSYGGAGGYVSGTLAVTPGETLTIVVGQGPAQPDYNIYYGYSESGSSGSYGGGGSRGYYSYAGAGGGRSAIRRAGNDIVTAGGGGGGAYYGAQGGAGGGSTGGTGSSGGTGGTQSSGGSGSDAGYGHSDGGHYYGGGYGYYYYSAGGGGGWYGGGGGGFYYMGGGGGSSYIANLTGTVVDTQGGGSPAQTNGSVTITKA